MQDLILADLQHGLLDQPQPELRGTLARANTSAKCALFIILQSLNTHLASKAIIALIVFDRHAMC
jgi:hypothetical protein